MPKSREQNRTSQGDNGTRSKLKDVSGDKHVKMIYGYE
jgi:hypothetical protein